MTAFNMNVSRAAMIGCWLASAALTQPSTSKVQDKPVIASPPTGQPPEFDRLQQEKVTEEIKKLKLETRALSNPPGPPAGTSIPILAACIAAVVALIVPQITAANQARADRRKEVRLAIAQYGANYAAAIHHIQWLTWKPANKVPLSRSDLDDYDTAMDVLFPQLIGSFLAASALQESLFGEMKDLYDSIIAIDIRIGQHIAEVRKTGYDDGVLLTTIFNEVNGLWNGVPAKFQGFMNV